MNLLALLAAGLMTLTATPEHLYSEVSAPGESVDAFALRIAPKARDTTKELGSEICGSFQKAGDQYRIAFTTSRSLWGCSIDFINEGEWKATRLTMHTHTEGGGHGFSAQDNKLKLQGYVVSYRAFTKRVGNIERTTTLPLDIRQAE